ncbi:MAG: ATP-grasp domain-containing protein [Armatimonadetes bacterium]|nr:ATP-grasp domain-containing protein [Armatimonadota bacterium]
MIVVFSQASPQSLQGAAEQNLRSITESARLAGHRVYHLPRNFKDATAADVLEYLPEMENGAGVFLGYVSGDSFYETLYEAALTKGVRMINSPEATRRAMEFEQFYPLIHDLTPKSVVVRGIDDVKEVTRSLGYPVFVKGEIKSRKELGWEACVVRDAEALRSRFLGDGKLIAREIAPFRPCPGLRSDFPASREYRCFLIDGKVVGMGFYWPTCDPYGDVTDEERQAIVRLAEEAARRIDCPLMVVDLGQLESGGWVVIETGDLQYSAVTQMSHMGFWGALGER